MKKQIKIAAAGLAILLLCVSGGIRLLHSRKAKHLAELKAKKNLNGLVAWWPADGDAIDLLSGTPDTLENKTKFAAGVAGFAFDFTPDRPLPFSYILNQLWQRLLGILGHPPSMVLPKFKHVRISDRPSLRFTNAMTAEAWICPASKGGFQEILGKWSAVYPARHAQESYTFAVVPDGRVYFGVSPVANGAGSQSVYGTTVLPLNSWSHVTGSYDGKALNIYVNGQLENSVSYDGGIFPGTYDVGIGGVVGEAPSGQSVSSFFGKIAELSLYNRALTPVEVRKDFESNRATAVN